jgi:hypothetical protein
MAIAVKHLWLCIASDKRKLIIDLVTDIHATISGKIKMYIKIAWTMENLFYENKVF